MTDTLSSILTDLTGQDCQVERRLDEATQKLFEGSGLGYSQLNELLLLLEYHRVSAGFFQFLVDGKAEYRAGAAFTALECLRKGVERFRKLAILRFGSVKFGFKFLAAPSTNLTEELAIIEPLDPEVFHQRHAPLVPVDPIPSEQTYYLGYLVKRQLDERIAVDPNDEQARRQLKEREDVVKKGKRNQKAYVASDYVDVYVATSMRERHEYQMIGRVVTEVFSSSELSDLKLRWFDPTQGYCEDRIDKSLSEGLMLKRATCTLYLAQESDTLGKDSELACTLAQGKPVVAYIPFIAESEAHAYVEDLLQMIAVGSPDSDERDLVLKQIRVFSPDASWRDPEVMRWIRDPRDMDLEAAKVRLGTFLREHYDSRAKTLKESHPLGIQMHLETGVANGVLVARSTNECAQLIRRILTRTLEFRIHEKIVDDNRYLLLKEAITDSVFRVVTGDEFLTNAFWDFYLAP